MIGRPFLGHDYPGTYIVFDGPGACGKSLQAEIAAKLLSDRYSDRKVLLTHEPGGTPRAEVLKKALISTKEVLGDELVPLEQAYVFAASRGHLIRNEIRPILEEGGIVVSDRWFLSSLAHQAVAGNLGFNTVYRLNEPMIDGVYPDISILLDVPKEVTKKRFDERGERNNVYDLKPAEYYETVRWAYLDYAKRLSFSPEGRQLILDGTRSVGSLSEEIFKVASGWIEAQAEQRIELLEGIRQSEGVPVGKERK